jgi:hypothetical protein
VPFFFSGNFAQRVECIPTCLAAGERPKYPDTTVEAHMREMYGRTCKAREGLGYHSEHSDLMKVGHNRPETNPPMRHS